MKLRRSVIVTTNTGRLLMVKDYSYSPSCLTMVGSGNHKNVLRTPASPSMKNLSVHNSILVAQTTTTSMTTTTTTTTCSLGSGSNRERRGSEIPTPQTATGPNDSPSGFFRSSPKSPERMRDL